MQTTRVTIIRKAANGEAPGWTALYERYGAVIIRYAHKLGLADAAAQDVLQETMVALMKILPGFTYDPARGRFRNFLLTIVHRKCLAALRRSRRLGEVSLDEESGETGLTLKDRLADDSSAADMLAKDEPWEESLLEQAMQVVAKDPRVDRATLDVFKAYVIEGRAATDVTAAFKLKENAVYQIRSRVLARLKEEVRRMMAELEEVGA